MSLTWASGTSLTGATAGKRLASVTYNGKIYAAQPGNTDIPVKVYDPAANTWSDAPHITGIDCSYSLEGIALNGKIYWFGVATASATYVTVIEYDTTAGVLHPTPSEVTNVVAPWMENLFNPWSFASNPPPQLVAATVSQNWQIFNALYVTSPNGNAAWSYLNLGDGSAAWQGATPQYGITQFLEGASASSNHFAYFLDGWTAAGRAALSSDVIRLDPFTATVKKIADDPNPCYLPQVVVASNRMLYVLGGHSASAALTNTRVLDLSTNTWTTDTAIPAARYGGGAHVINGIIYLVGGKDSSGVETFTVSKATLPSFTPVSPPADSFASATALSGTTDGDTFTLVGASQEWNEPGIAPLTHNTAGVRIADVANSTWYTWTATANGSVTVTTKNTPLPNDYYLVIDAWHSGATIDDLQWIDYSAADSTFASSTQAFPAQLTIDCVAGQTYYWRVVLFTGTTARTDGVFSLTSLAFERPANDNFVNATVLTGTSGNAAVNTLYSTSELNDPNYASLGETATGGVWYKVTPVVDATLLLNTASTSPAWDSQIQVFTGTDISSLVETIHGRGQDGLQLTVTAGTTYYIRVSAQHLFSASQDERTDAVLTWGLYLPPDNDNWANAQILTGTSGQVVCDTFLATQEDTEPSSIAQSPVSSVWYSWTPTANATALFTTNLTPGNDFDSVIEVFTGALGSTSGAYSGPKLWGVSEDAYIAGRLSTYDSAVTAAGAKLNTYRIYRKVSTGTNQIKTQDVTQHNAGRLLVHSLRTDNLSDGVSAWASIAAGNHDTVIDAFISQALALDFSAGKPQYVFTSLDPETSRFVNGASSSDDHGTPTEFIAAHQHYYNRIRAADPGGRILVGFCDQWYWYKNHPDSVAAVYPGDAYVDLSLGDLTYNKSESQSTWEEASAFIADYRSWVSTYSFMVGKQIMCIEGDCEDWGTSGWPTGSTGVDTTKKADWLRNFGAYIRDTADFIGFAYWDVEYPVNTSSDALTGYVDAAVLAQSTTSDNLSLVVADDWSGSIDPQWDAALAAWIATAGTTYYVRVTPYYASQNEQRTDAVLSWSTAAVPSAPPSAAPTITLDHQTDDGTFTRSWIAASGTGDAIWFNLYNAADNSLIWQHQPVGSLMNPAFFDSTPNVYQVYATAENIVGESLHSNILELPVPPGNTTVPDPPPDQSTTGLIYITLTDDTADVAPDLIVGSVGNAQADTQVDFFFDGQTVAFTNSISDDDGTIFNIALLVPGGMGVGDHTVTVNDGTSSGSATFHILSDPTSDDTTPPDLPPQQNFGPRWVLHDPAIPESFTFAINPSSMGSPFPERNLTADFTISPLGQAHVWEGNSKAATWTFSGQLLEQSQYDELARWSLKMRRVYLTDHFKRVWVVVLTNFDAKPHGTRLAWRHDYTMSALVLGRHS